MATLRQVESAARARYGRNASVIDLKGTPGLKLPTPDDRKTAPQKVAQLTARMTELEREIKSLDGWDVRLVNAARFVVDVNGDSPSIERLGSAVTDAELRMHLLDERSEVRKERDAARQVGYTFRFRVSEFQNGPIPLNMIHQEADTLDELLAKIERKAVAK